MPFSALANTPSCCTPICTSSLCLPGEALTDSAMLPPSVSSSQKLSLLFCSAMQWGYRLQGSVIDKGEKGASQPSLGSKILLRLWCASVLKKGFI